MPRIFRTASPDSLDLPKVDLVEDLLCNQYNVPLDTIAFISAESGKSYTFAAVKRRVACLANGLRSLAVKERDVVALFSPNSIDYAIICLAVIGCGATVACISAALTAEELRDQLRTARAKMIIADDSLLSIAEEAIKGTSVGTVVATVKPSGTQAVKSADEMASNGHPGDLTQISAEEAAERPAFLCFSSGTSGKSKAVIITHHMMTSNMRQWEQHTDCGSMVGSVQMGFLPLAHVYGLHFYCCGGLRRGATTVILRQFDPDVFLRSIERYRPRELQIVPPVAILLAKDPRVEKYNLSSVQSILCAAAPLSKELGLAIEERFKKLWGIKMYCWQAWGLSETTPFATGLHARNMDRRFSVGNFAPGLEARVVNPETLKDVPLNPNTGWTEPGELWLMGPNITPGYLNNPEATQGAFHIDSDGRKWFRTGDLAQVDKGGYVVLQDRLKEMIK